MRMVLATIAAMLVIVGVIATSTASASSKSFVGPADDAFFVDLGAVFDGINIDKPGRP